MAATNQLGQANGQEELETDGLTESEDEQAFSQESI